MLLYLEFGLLNLELLRSNCVSETLPYGCINFEWERHLLWYSVITVIIIDTEEEYEFYKILDENSVEFSE